MSILHMSMARAAAEMHTWSVREEGVFGNAIASIEAHIIPER